MSNNPSQYILPIVELYADGNSLSQRLGELIASGICEFHVNKHSVNGVTTYSIIILTPPPKG